MSFNCSADEELFPNIFTFLKNYNSIPATICECERSASALRRLHTYSRVSMKKERLCALALMQIHYGKVIDEEKIVDIFSQNYSRHLQLRSVLTEIILICCKNGPLFQISHPPITGSGLICRRKICVAQSYIHTSAKLI